jgi:Ca2+-binding EF-hand superfamily protein
MIRNPNEAALLEQVVAILQSLDMSTGPLFNIQSVGSLLRILNYNPSSYEIEQFMAKLDPKKKEQFSPSQFVDTLKNFQFTNINEEILLKALVEMDTDNDGEIPTKELADILTNYSETLNDNELKELLKDIESDGKVKIADIMNKLKQQ